MFRKFLFYTEAIFVALVAIAFLFVWMIFAGPQMHVAETFSGLAIALLILLLGLFWVRRRRHRREAAAEALRQEAELERQRAEEELRLRAAREEEALRAAREAQRQAEREARVQREAERARNGSTEKNIAPENANTGKFNVREFIDELLLELTEQEQSALSGWLKKLLEIRELDTTKEKLRSLGKTLKNSRALAPVAKLILVKMKKYGWDDLGGVAKWAVGAGGGALLLFGGAGAGIAAFGGAIGVPLFVVFGAGGALAGAIIQEIERRSNK